MGAAERLLEETPQVYAFAHLNGLFHRINSKVRTIAYSFLCIARLDFRANNDD